MKYFLCFLHEKLFKEQITYKSPLLFSLPKQGITLLEELCKKNPEGKRDYIYYLALAYTRLKEYSTAMKYVQAFLEIEPNNQQVIVLEEYIKKKIDIEGLKGAAMAGGAALVLGGILGIGFALAKK